MNLKKSHLLYSVVSAACLALASAASAQGFTGFVAFAAEGQSGTWSSSTLALDSFNLVTGIPQGSFSVVPRFSQVNASTTPITGLSTSATPVVVNDFFQFSSMSDLGINGTSPNNRFDFNLATLTDIGGGFFSGTGTLVDITGAFAATPATFTVAFSGVNNYSVTLQASALTPVPEPATISLIAVGSLGAFLIRRRKA